MDNICLDVYHNDDHYECFLVQDDIAMAGFSVGEEFSLVLIAKQMNVPIVVYGVISVYLDMTAKRYVVDIRAE